MKNNLVPFTLQSYTDNILEFNLNHFQKILEYIHFQKNSYPHLQNFKLIINFNLRIKLQENFRKIQ
jgi:hypothetical protein